MDCFIYISSIDFYLQVVNSEFFDTINEFVANDWKMSTVFDYEENDLLIDFYAEKNHVKIEVGHLCQHRY